jgi:hypothetical protein
MKDSVHPFGLWMVESRRGRTADALHGAFHGNKRILAMRLKHGLVPRRVPD